MDKKLIKIYNGICEKNDEILKRDGYVSPICFIIKKNYNLDALVFKFENKKEKENLRQHLKKFLLNSEMRGYILVFDTKLTMFDIKDKTKKPIVKDCVMRTLYTAKGGKRELVFYEDKKITKKKLLDEAEFAEMRDEWDLWGQGIDKNDDNIKGFDYSKFKEENRELYEEVTELFENYNQIINRTTGEIGFAYKFNHKNKTISFYMSEDFKIDNKDKIPIVFKTFKASGYKLVEVDENEKEIKNG